MNADDLTEMQSPENWEFVADAERPRRPRKARAVVSVAFAADDFERIAQYAEAHGFKISEFIRAATLASVSGATARTTSHMALMSAGGAAQMMMYFQEMTPATIASAATFDAEQVPF